MHVHYKTESSVDRKHAVLALGGAQRVVAKGVPEPLAAGPSQDHLGILVPPVSSRVK